MAKINISTLSKEAVILALFNNVYGKSEPAKQRKREAMRFSPNEPGIYSAPISFEISKILDRNKYIDYLGCVRLHMDFSGNVIDTDHYDKLHETGTNGVESATSVIEKLRPKRELKEEVKSSAESSSLSYASSSSAATVAKRRGYDSISHAIAEEKLTALLGKPCGLMHLYLDNFVFKFSSEQSYETLQKDAALLVSKGIIVMAEPPVSLSNGYIVVEAKLRFKGALSDVVTQLSSVSPSVTSSTIKIPVTDSVSGDPSAAAMELSLGLQNLRLSASSDSELKSLASSSEIKKAEREIEHGENLMRSALTRAGHFTPKMSPSDIDLIKPGWREKNFFP